LFCPEAEVYTPGRHLKGVRVDITLFLKGLLIGLAIAAPVGPIGVLCIRRTLNEGRLAGFITGMGAATADALYGAIAALGISAVSSRLVEHADPIRLIGGAFLFYLGVKTLLTESDGSEATARGGGSLGIYGSALALTITNPTTILSFVAVFAGLGLAETADDRGAAGLIVLGVFLGSAAWWVFLSNFVGAFRRALTPARRIWINRLSGVILVGFGGFALVSVLRNVL
jgi:threonine/homoserine/homoserine lactone efflux protein